MTANNRLENIARLSAEKRALFESLLAAKSRKEATGIPVVSRQERSAFPLSFAQQRLWFLAQLEADSPAYNVPYAVRLHGSLNYSALEQSLNEIVRRHESLRTVFVYADEMPMQIIRESMTIPLPVTDLQDVPTAEHDRRLNELASTEWEQLFDLAQGPLLRVRLVCLTETDHLFIVIMHHIVSDGWSWGVFTRELSAFYNAYTAGDLASPPAPSTSSGRGLSEVEGLPELPIQYVDFAVWQRDYLQGEKLQAQVAYWKEKLANLPPALELPTDRPPAARINDQMGCLRSPLPPSLIAGLQGLAQREGVTLFVVLLSAFQLLLARLSRQTDIAIGTPIAGRTRAEIEDLIGVFLNTLVLRADLSGNPTFREFLQRQREMTLGAYANQEAPFEKLVEELQPQRDVSGTPFFQVLFAFQNASVELPHFTGVISELFVVEKGAGVFDLTVAIEERAHGLDVRADYSEELFDAPTITRFLRQYQTLLEGILAAPETRLAALPLLAEAERQQLLVEWNATEVTYPPAVCIHELFEAQAKRTPTAPALRYEGQTLSYQELNERANQLAQYLRHLGVGPEVRVGICLERSLEMVIGLLGILKAGGAYVPLDPSYPEERLAYMLADARIEVLVTQERWLVAGGGSRVTSDQLTTICLDTEWDTITSHQPPATRYQLPTPDSLIYIIYTSGSTGQPKGAMNSHRGLYNRLLWMQDAYHLTEADRVLQKTPFSFDVSGWEFFWPLITGATLVIARPGGHQDSQYLAQLITQEQITTLHFVPSMLQIFLEEPSVAQCHSLQRVICSGEALPVEVVERFYKVMKGQAKTPNSSQIPEAERRGQNPTPKGQGPRVKGQKDNQQSQRDFQSEIINQHSASHQPPATNNQPPALHNLYGPTEAAIDVTYWACVPGAERHSIPIGRPIANTQIYILDAQMQPTPIGVPGELYIGGVGLGRGYFQRPELTAEKFVPNPFAGIADEGRKTKDESSFLRPSSFVLRLYKTGDLARYLPDGNIEFLGRLDHQVKVRGFRIELGEIEAALARHPAVREVVVVARETARANGDKQLVAYLSLHASQSVTTSELRSFLQKSLPEYMLPGAFVFLEALPLNPNGKVDRRQLPDPGAARPELERPWVAPRTPVEEELAGIWRELLKVERVGVYDNFFELGGHSLLLIQLASRLRSRFQIELPLRLLFDMPTLDELTTVIAANQIKGQDAAEVDQLIAELEQLSPEEVQAMLEAES
jgi:non-ribosomal peptide synthetase component F/acyl carrier protein